MGKPKGTSLLRMMKDKLNSLFGIFRLLSYSSEVSSDSLWQSGPAI